ncbi:amino acid synthesis family protein [Sinomonas humi]|uniref:Peptide synthetase n=1 Tax=Sinomonas humi TaxID=1338436 RepID=A0A0B2AFZ8_9MICC|nr:amino acid synthesis family protein [Sinomonas humi]KHL02449.1 peptide synthetase [Sinomonas humi]
MRSLPENPEELIRKIVFLREEILLENGAAPLVPAARAAAAAVVVNPWAGLGPDSDLTEAAQWLAPAIAGALIERLLSGLGGPDAVEAFGKGAIVGTAGEIEHGGALIHTPYFGNLLRESLEGTSIICFADSRGDAGEALVVPMWHKTAAATRSHYQTVDIRIPDAPLADEIVVVAAASTGPRPHARIGDRKTDTPVSWSTLVGASR